MRTIRLFRYALAHPKTAARGAWEFRGGVGLNFPDDDARSEAYDAGRELAHIATLRYFDYSLTWDRNLFAMRTALRAVTRRY